MTEAEWLVCADVATLLEGLASERRDRRLRLFACGCCRQARRLMADECSRNAIEVAERFADGDASESELIAAQPDGPFWRETIIGAARLAAVPRYDRPSILHYYGIMSLANLDEALYSRLAHICANDCRFPTEAALAVARRISKDGQPQADLLRDIFGNPFRPATLDPAWRTSTVLSLASQMYESRDFGAMPILADALQDAGCDNEEVLGHCRGPGPHVRGCWVVDLVLGK